MLLLPLLVGCEEPVVAEDESARGEFIMNGVIRTEITDPYSYAGRCTGYIEVILRTQANEQMTITMDLLAPEALITETWELGTSFDFAYIDDPMSPGDWLASYDGWLRFDAFQAVGGRVIGEVDIWGEMNTAEGEILEPEYHIYGTFNVPRTDSCP